MNELLEQLEAKIQAAVEQIGLYQLEIEELKENNADLEAQREAWNAKLTGLIEKFEQLDSEEDEDASDEDGESSDDENSGEENEGDASEENQDGNSDSEEHHHQEHHE